MALVHGLGTGTDARLGWVQLLTFACAAAVTGSVVWRIAHDWPPARRAPRMVAGGVGAATVVIVAVWTITGPLRPGWAKRAGTPAPLLATARIPSTSGTKGAPARREPTAAQGATATPSPPYSAALNGNLTQTSPGSSGQVTVTINTAVSGKITGALQIVLRGRPAGTGVSIDASEVTFGPSADPSLYKGALTTLDGDRLIAAVTASSRTPLELVIDLQINQVSGAVRGTLSINSMPPALGTSANSDDRP